VNAPSFLPVVISVLMLLVAVYAAWRLAFARLLERATDVETDLLHLAVGLAGAGMVAHWAQTLPHVAWTAVFAAGTGYFAVRLARARGEARRAPAVHAGLCAVVLYMLTAGVGPSTIHGSTAGMYTMAGMPGMSKDPTITFPGIGLVAVAALAFYAVTVLSRISPPEPGTPRIPAPAKAAAPAPVPDRVGALLAPRSVALCRVALALVLAYAILSKLV
jgi:hypothetical protein